MCIESMKSSRQGVALPRHKAENDLNKLSAFLYLAAFYNSLFLLRVWTSGAVRPRSRTAGLMSYQDQPSY